jgi:hypothetical protein
LADVYRNRCTGQARAGEYSDKEFFSREITMRHSHAAVPLAAMFLSFQVLGQSLTAGKYSGRIDFNYAGTMRSEMATLTVEKVEGDQIQGVAWIGTSNCKVDVPVRGRWEGDTLKVRGKAVSGCGVSWDLRLVGDKLEGTTSAGSAIRLSK